MCELDYKESWVQKNWCFWTVVFEKTLESPLDHKEIQLVHPKGDQSWVFIGRTDVEAETPILWPPDVKSWLIWKDPDAGKDWGLEEKGMTEDEMVGWHHWLDGCGLGWTPGVGDGQGGLACCGSWGRKELDTTERLNWDELTTCCFLKKYLFLFIYLTLPGLNCSMWDLVPWPGIKTLPPALGAWCLGHCATREVPAVYFIFISDYGNDVGLPWWFRW